MKKVIAVFVTALIATSAMAAIKCVPDGRGGMCCWDTDRHGPWKPLNC